LRAVALTDFIDKSWLWIARLQRLSDFVRRLCRVTAAVMNRELIGSLDRKSMIFIS